MTRFLAVAVGLALFAAGCGGDDNGGGSDKEISKADFVEQANAICKKGNDELAKAGQEAQPTSQDEIESFIKDKLVPNIQGQIDDIRDLGFPKGDEDTLDGVLSDAEDTLDKISDDPNALSGSDDPFADINKQFTDYGLTTCGSTS